MTKRRLCDHVTSALSPLLPSARVGVSSAEKSMSKWMPAMPTLSMASNESRRLLKGGTSETSLTPARG